MKKEEFEEETDLEFMKEEQLFKALPKLSVRKWLQLSTKLTVQDHMSHWFNKQMYPEGVDDTHWASVYGAPYHFIPDLVNRLVAELDGPYSARAYFYLDLWLNTRRLGQQRFPDEDEKAHLAKVDTALQLCKAANKHRGLGGARGGRRGFASAAVPVAMSLIEGVGGEVLKAVFNAVKKKSRSAGPPPNPRSLSKLVGPAMEFGLPIVTEVAKVGAPIAMELAAGLAKEVASGVAKLFNKKKRSLGGVQLSAKSRGLFAAIGPLIGVATSLLGQRDMDVDDDGDDDCYDTSCGQVNSRALGLLAGPLISLGLPIATELVKAGIPLTKTLVQEVGKAVNKGATTLFGKARAAGICYNAGGHRGFNFGKFAKAALPVAGAIGQAALGGALGALGNRELEDDYEGYYDQYPGGERGFFSKFAKAALPVAGAVGQAALGGALGALGNRELEDDYDDYDDYPGGERGFFSNFAKAALPVAGAVGQAALGGALGALANRELEDDYDDYDDYPGGERGFFSNFAKAALPIAGAVGQAALGGALGALSNRDLENYQRIVAHRA